MNVFRGLLYAIAIETVAATLITAIIIVILI